MDDIDITAYSVDETMERTVEKSEILVDILNSVSYTHLTLPTILLV